MASSSLFPSITNIAQLIPNGDISITSNFLQPEQVNALRADAHALYSAGAFVKGGLRLRPHPNNNNRHDKRKKKKKGPTSSSSSSSSSSSYGVNEANEVDDANTHTNEKTRLCDICGLFDDAEKDEYATLSTVNRNARENLLDIMSDLREILMEELDLDDDDDDAKLLESMELQYLHYPGSSGGKESGGGKKSGFYQRHYDHTGDDDKPYRRKVSLLLYLNEEGWNGETDGGILRAYIRPKKRTKRSRVDGDGDGDGDAGDDSPPPSSTTTPRATTNTAVVKDIVPEGGKLVLFDSTLVEHEVLPTCRERWAVVGWFLIEKETKIGARVRGNGNGNDNGGDGNGGNSSKRCHFSGNEQSNNNSFSRKKKKKRRKRR